ncbi:hypothetical protein BN7_3619 [Wickerhamomyces ciferrii]|uniref:Uncharacterized protein n=1 Tax=Wickerhamomyces ciferrii (strain ATCC 14091 / BCRC 22168 / CBS 111 / JCM 3599 / NBRC 0793 / NRRL Y-1031 F-60-10) TaxID=1206466 RepID=K0KFX5_WICCF|nr:uncharacterized protein BN7_3619 [Wickerhamomyces ciferrii]CCH44060.1 hypothetical protein BN7_3619 [Wickerhamomyces ciferrii]
MENEKKRSIESDSNAEDLNQNDINNNTKKSKKSTDDQHQTQLKFNSNHYLDDIFDLRTRMKTKDFEVLVKFTDASSFKLFCSSKEVLEIMDMRDQYQNYELSDQVFCKIYDIDLLKLLFRNKSRRYIAEEFDQVHFNIMESLEEVKNIKFWIDYNMKRFLFKEHIALKRIESWNSMNDESNQINTAKLLQYGWADDFTMGDDKYSLFGPFLIFEKIDFINDNEISSSKRREESFRKQAKLLKRSGISHGSLHKYNYCFNQDDECFIIDFGNSTVDDDSILDDIFDKKDIWPE